MDDGAAIASTSNENTSDKMVATNTNNTARKAILEERKRQIEEKLSKCNQDLKQLCIQEAEITGITPPEMPLEVGESPPTIRRKVGTAFELNQNLLNNSNKDQLIADLELEIQVIMNMRDAALGLSGDGNISKTVKRQHRAEYQKYKEQVKALEEKLAALREKAEKNDQIKQKKKSRLPEPQDDNISIATTIDPFGKTEHRHSQMSKHMSMLSPADTYPEPRYPTTSKQSHYRNSDNVNYHYQKPEELLTSGFYRLSLNGYNEYLERQEVMSNMSHYYTNQHNHNYAHSSHMTHMYPQSSPSSISQSGYSPRSHNYINQSYYSQHSPVSQHRESHSPLSQHSVRSQRMQRSSPTNSYYYAKNEPYSRYAVDNGYRNTVAYPIQPHQQYENNGMNSGLGGCWKRSESGEMFWVNSSSVDVNWPRDKRFGSLDRSKNKRIQRRISPVDSKSATLATTPVHCDQVKTAFVKPSQVTNRRSQDHRALVRTQSLGSVGQTIDSVYPSDDASSCESDNRSFKDRSVRKQKEKEWTESSLDGPISPTHSVISRSQSTIPTALTPEEKYLHQFPPRPPSLHSPHIQNPSPIQSPLSPRSLEIPAESNPSLRVPESPNLEILNNNIPKNCTIVQAGVVRPYHEETKPFEMSDFYKYSTKFKKSPQKEAGKGMNLSQSPARRFLNDNFEEVSVNRYPVTVQQQFVHHSSTRETSLTSSLNSSLELGQITVSERFSEEMNAWYHDQEQHNENNNTKGSKVRSSATLV